MHQRVLSERYIHRAATLGRKPQRSAHHVNSREKTDEILRENSLFSVEKHTNLCSDTMEMNRGSQKDSPGLVSRSRCKPSYKERKSFSKNVDHQSLGHLQKLEDVFSTSRLGEIRKGDMNIFSKSKSKMIDKSHFASTRCKVVQPTIEKVNRRYRHQRLVDSSKDLSTGANYVDYPEAFSSSCSVFAPDTNCNSGPHLLLNQPFLEDKKSEDWETRKTGQNDKVMKKYESKGQERSALCQISSIQGRNSGFIVSPCLNFTEQQRDLDFEVSSYYSCTDSDNDDPEAYKIEEDASNCSENDTFKEFEYCQAINFTRDLVFRNSFSDKLAAGRSSYLMDFPIAKESINESSEGVLDYAKYHTNPLSIKKYSVDINHSPDSVLEPSEFLNSSTDEYIESIDQQSQLRILDLPESEVEESGETKGECISNPYKQLGDNKSRDFSYLADVLDKARFFSQDSTMNIESWCSLECPIGLSIFDELEKTYGSHISWKKSDRLLLFDLINSGLIQMVDQIHSTRTSTKSVVSGLDRDEIENKLRTMLIVEEKAKNRDMSEKAVEGAMNICEVNESVNIICRELGSFLFDELVGEYVSLWQF